MEKKEIRIEEVNGKIEIYTPYNAEFVKAIKMIGQARWDRSKSCWITPADYIEDVRGIMYDVYGCDDQGTAETVDVKIEFLDDYRVLTGGVDICNQTIAYATGRDSGAKVGPNTMLISGSITSGGSARNWETRIEKGSVFKVKGVMKSMLDKILESGIWPDDSCHYDGKVPATITVIDTNIDIDALKKEKERLEARLAEINQILERAEG